MLESFFNEVAGRNWFSNEYCEIFSNNFFYRAPVVTASVLSAVVRGMMMHLELN